MKLITLALVLAFSSSASANVDPNNFWDTQAPSAHSSVTYDALLQVEGINSTPVYLNDINHQVTLNTQFTVTSKSDRLPIDQVTVNRGQCQLYYKAHVTNVSLGRNTYKVWIYKEVQDGQYSGLIARYGEAKGFITNCKANQILEVAVVTPNNTLSWDINQSKI